VFDLIFNSFNLEEFIMEATTVDEKELVLEDLSTIDEIFEGSNQEKTEIYAAACCCCGV